MIRQKEIRTYEMSIWTLQDSFITVLKWANFEQLGEIENPILTLDIDGTQELKFSIPMYINIATNKTENPIWYNTLNGNLIINMRKIKVILNKTTEKEEVYEFLITKINERHEKEQIYCDVECEGLTFHELGKIGYNISLSSDDFYNDYEKWFKNGTNLTTMPCQTLQYWNDKFLTPLPENLNDIIPNKWYYKVEMNWDSYENSQEKSTERVYEEEYVSSWDVDTYSNENVVYPKTISKIKEKERPINVQESNIYNITQTIAETFGVFCKYKYLYDENYHIIGKLIIYYNNFIEEEKGSLDINYFYQSSKIVREKNSTDIITKMFIKLSNNDDINIMDIEANRSKENYLLNFDYLNNFNIISSEQYKEINTYENNLYVLNTQLSLLEKEINVLSNKKIDIKSKYELAKKAVITAEEQINTAADHLITLSGSQNKVVTIDGFNSKAVFLIEDKEKGWYYIDIPFIGVLQNTVKLISGIMNYNNSQNPLIKGTEINDGIFEYDEFNNLTKIVGLSSPASYGLTTNLIWLQCSYIPYTYWTKVQEYWQVARAQAEEEQRTFESELTALEANLSNKQNRYEQYLEDKEKIKKSFEELMGPALREGYWCPENYKDYNNKFLVEIDSPWGSKTIGNYYKKENISYYWDSNLFDDEEDIVFKQGNYTRQYLMINLSNLSAEDWSFIKRNYNNLSFVYYDEGLVSLDSSELKTRNIEHTIHIGGGCKFSVIQRQGTIIPVLIIKDSYLFSNKQLNFIKTQEGTYRSKIVSREFVVENNSVDVYEDIYSITIASNSYLFGELNNSTDWLRTYDNISSRRNKAIHLRIEIDNLNVKTFSSDLQIKLSNSILNEYEDYYITKTESLVYVNIKSEKLIELYDETNPNYILYEQPPLVISYILCNASTAIYLDAKEILKENSMPKVSYTIDLNIINESFIYDIYNKLSRIVHINDYDLKFENVQGYISNIEMDLGHPWKDKIEIKNYKTKFEDLFCNIVAQTEDMKKNKEYYNNAAGAFNSDGSIKIEALSQTLQENSDIISKNISLKIVQENLKSLFNEAGNLLSNAGNALDNIHSLSLENSDILSGFFNGVQEGFSKGIDYTVPYDLVTGDAQNISAVRINKDEGIFIGSNKKITLSTTSAIKDNNGNYVNDPAIINSGANVELTPSRLLMGVSNFTSNNDGVVDITSDQIILAVGNNAASLETDATKKITNQPSLSGIQIKKDYIGLASGSGDNRSIVSIEPSNITFGSVNNNQNGSYVLIQQSGIDIATSGGQNGSYVKIAQSGIEIGSNADIWINTNNLAIKTVTENNVLKRIFRLGVSDSSYDLFYKTNEGLKIKSSLTVGDSTGNNPYLSYSISEGLQIKGKVTATEFILGGNGNITYNNVNYNLSTMQQQIDKTHAISTVIHYAKSSSGTSIPSSGWQTSIPSVSQNWYLWTRTTINYTSGTSYSYSVSYMGKDGSNGKYVKSVVELYYLKESFYPSQPSGSSPIRYSSDTTDSWTTVIPSYKYGCIYYRCEQYEWSDNTYTWSSYYQDNALTYPNKIVKKFEINGLIMDYKWGNITYPIALTSNQNLLIGANSGITIAKSSAYSDGDAVIINNNGISLLGKTINLKAAGATESSIILSESGIDIQTAGHIKMRSGGTFDIVATEGQMSFGTGNNINFTVDKEGNIYCKNLNCQNIISDNFCTTNGTIVAQDPSSTQSDIEIETNSVTTRTFSPIRGYLPGGGGTSGTFYTVAVFDDANPYTKADIYLYFTNIGAEYWTVGTFQLYVEDALVGTVSGRVGATLTLSASNVSIPNYSTVKIKATSSINAGTYSSSFTFKKASSYVRSHS